MQVEYEDSDEVVEITPDSFSTDFHDTTSLFTQDLESEHKHNKRKGRGGPKTKTSPAPTPKPAPVSVPRPAPVQVLAPKAKATPIKAKPAPTPKPKPPKEPSSSSESSLDSDDEMMLARNHEDQRLMEQTELPKEDIDLTLIVHGIPKTHGEGSTQKKLLTLLKEKYSIVPLLVGRFNRNENYWRVSFKSSDLATKLCDKKDSLEIRMKGGAATTPITFRRPITYAPPVAKRARSNSIASPEKPRKKAKKDSKPEKTDKGEKSEKSKSEKSSKSEKTEKNEMTSKGGKTEKTPPPKPDDKLTKKRSKSVESAEQPKKKPKKNLKRKDLVCDHDRKSYPIVESNSDEYNALAGRIVCVSFGQSCPQLGNFFLIRYKSTKEHFGYAWMNAADAYTLIPRLVFQYYERAFHWKRLPFWRDENQAATAMNVDGNSEEETGSYDQWETINFF